MRNLSRCTIQVARNIFRGRKWTYHFLENTSLFMDCILFLCDRFGLDAEKIFPYSALLGELQRIGKYGLVISFLHHIFWAIMAGYNDFNDMFENGSDAENTVNSLDRLHVNDSLKTRLLDILTDVAQRNYI